MPKIRCRSGQPDWHLDDPVLALTNYLFTYCKHKIKQQRYKANQTKCPERSRLKKTKNTPPTFFVYDSDYTNCSENTSRPAPNIHHHLDYSRPRCHQVNQNPQSQQLLLLILFCEFVCVCALLQPLINPPYSTHTPLSGTNTMSFGINL